MDKVFIDNLKAARIAANKTQKDVADAIGVAKSTYSQYETGKREPGIIGIKKIAKYLDVSPDALIGSDYQQIWLNVEDNALMFMFKDLNEIGRKKVMEYASDIYDRYKNV